MTPVEQRIPHRPPFLFVDEITSETDTSIATRRKVRGDEDFFKGHYPGNPIMPGVLICEAVFQTGCILFTRMLTADGKNPADFTPVLTRIQDVRFKNPVRPGDELVIEVKLKERMGKFIFMSGSVRTAADAKVLTVDFGVAMVDSIKPVSDSAASAQ